MRCTKRGSSALEPRFAAQNTRTIARMDARHPLEELRVRLVVDDLLAQCSEDLVRLELEQPAT